MKKLINFILGIFAFLLYVQCRIVHLPVFWLGFPSLQMWVTQNEMMKRHIVTLIAFYINMVLFIFFGWWVLIALLIQILTIFVIINRQIKKA